MTRLVEKIFIMTESRNSNDNLLSIASLWEIAIKSSIGKLDLELSIEQLIEEQNEKSYISGIE